MNELKPCPFCQGEAQYSCVALDYPTQNIEAYVYCDCGVELSVSGNIKNTKDILKQAIEKWNTRVTPKNEPLTLGQVKERIDKQKPIYITDFIIKKNKIVDKFGYWYVSCGDSDFVDLTDYKKLWLAFDYEPTKEESS